MNKALTQSLTGAVKTLLYGSGMVGLARRVGVQGNQLPMVRYHSISESPDYCPRSISVPAGLFEREIAYLAANYVVLKHEQAVECLLMGRPFPSRAVVISFDDGYKDNVTTALPILTRYGVSAIFYVAAGPVLERERFWVGWLQRAIFGAPRPLVVAEAFEIPLESVSSPRGVDRQALVDAVSRRINTGSRAVRHNALRLVEEALAGTSTIPDGVEFMMNVDDLLQLSRAGMELGSHTVSHAVLTGLPDEEAADELQRSRAMLEQALDAPVRHLAYPNGPCDANFDENSMKLAAAAGYRSAVTSRRGPFSRDSDPLALPRQGINYRLSLAAFAFKVEEHRFGSLLMN